MNLMCYILWSIVKLGLFISFGLPLILLIIYYLLIIVAYIIQLIIAIPKEAITQIKNIFRRRR